MKRCGCADRLAVLIVVVVGICWSATAQVPSVTIGQNFTGIVGDGITTPPDANGAVGPLHFVEFINGDFTAYNKTDASDFTRLADTEFWTQAGVTLSSSDAITDPRVIYDPASQRWFASMVDFNANARDPTVYANNFLIAVSLSSDPTGTWKGFRFRADPTSGRFADFPTLGVDANAVYLAGDFYRGGTNPVGPGLVSIPKSSLLSNNPTTNNLTWSRVMSYSQRGQVLQPATCFDGTEAGHILSASDIGTDSSPHSNLVSFVVQGATGPGATLSASTFIPTPAWEVPDNPYNPYPEFAILQPDGTDTLEGNDARISAKVYAVGGVLYAVHQTYWNGHVAIRWYRVRAADNTLLESGTLSDPNLDLFFPSIAVNRFGTMVIGYNGSGPGTHITCYAVVGQTWNGVTSFGTPIVLQTSAIDYHDLYEQLAEAFGETATSRWGDYSATSVDPSDPTRFWTIQSYAVDDPNNGSVWATQITELITAPLPLLSIASSGHNISVSWPAGVTGYQLQATTNLVAGIGWTNITQTPVTNGGQLVLTMAASNARQFFRLKQP
jgi:hypothetical protein